MDVEQPSVTFGTLSTVVGMAVMLISAGVTASTVYLKLFFSKMLTEWIDKIRLEIKAEYLSKLEAKLIEKDIEGLKK